LVVDPQVTVLISDLINKIIENIEKLRSVYKYKKHSSILEDKDGFRLIESDSVAETLFNNDEIYLKKKSKDTKFFYPSK